MTDAIQDINERQNKPEFLDLLCAADTAHHQAQRWEALRWIGVFATAVLALIAASHPSLQRAMSITGVIAAIFITLVIPIPSGRRTVLAALIQEHLDTRLFHLPTNPLIGRAPLGEAVDDLATKFHGDITKKHNWYLDVRGLGWPYAVLLCQRENLVWDFRQRKAWAIRVCCATVTWIAAGIVVGLSLDWSVRELFLRWFVPSAALIIAGSQEALAHQRIGQEKEDSALELESRLAAAPAGVPDQTMADDLLTFARHLQDKITDSRKKTARVPPQFYEHRRAREERLHVATGARLRDRLLAPVDP